MTCGRGTWPEQQAAGCVVVALALDDAPLALLALRDEVRPEAPEALAALRARGLRLLMCTGDAEATALAVAHTVGLREEDVRAQRLPQEKAALLQESSA